MVEQCHGSMKTMTQPFPHPFCSMDGVGGWFRDDLSPSHLRALYFYCHDISSTSGIRAQRTETPDPQTHGAR